MTTKIIVIGINHKKTPLDIRERFFLTETEQSLLLSEMKNDSRIIEAFVLSTCNRVEIYAHLLDTGTDPFFLIPVVCRIKKFNFSADLTQYFYVHAEEQAARHLLRVAAGLDSMVIGEKQILGQVKAAVDQARRMALLQKSFNILTHYAIRAGKKAQSETRIGWGGSSIGWAAVARAEQILGGLKDKTVLVIGAGKMSRLAMSQISLKSPRKIYIINRTFENAALIAGEFKAETVSLYDLRNTLVQADVCISAVAAPHGIIDRLLIESVMGERPGRPLTLIDIAVPRNIDPLSASVPGVNLSSVDDLKDVIKHNLAVRENAILAVEAIIEQKLADFLAKISMDMTSSSLFEAQP